MARKKKFQAPIKKNSPTLERKALAVENLKILRARKAYWLDRRDPEAYQKARSEIVVRLNKAQAELTKLDLEHSSAHEHLAGIADEERAMRQQVLILKNYKNIKRLQELAAKAVEMAQVLQAPEDPESQS